IRRSWSVERACCCRYGARHKLEPYRRAYGDGHTFRHRLQCGRVAARNGHHRRMPTSALRPTFLRSQGDSRKQSPARWVRRKTRRRCSSRKEVLLRTVWKDRLARHSRLSKRVLSASASVSPGMVKEWYSECQDEQGSRASPRRLRSPAATCLRVRV